MKCQPTERKVQREQANREELVERIAQCLDKDGAIEPLKGLRFFRFSARTNLIPSVMRPALCIVAQGSKEFFLGNERYLYDPEHYLIVTVDLPLVGHVTEASHERPYLSLSLELDPVLVGSVMIEAGYKLSSDPAQVKAINVSRLDSELLDAVVRLVRLIDHPAEARVLAPLVTREIIYRLLIGEQGERLCHIAVLSGYTPLIVQAIERLRGDLDQPLRIDALAREIGMSVSGFYRQFKVVTSISPLQFRKQMRLQQARRLMLGEGLDAASAGYRVGYHNPSHFNRDYKNLFGVPPIRDIERWRDTNGQNANDSR
ncbi:MAG: AraC family transcriptional regulator [Anaerolineae bacterium]|nr:AraC family transcriptional regulator [Anaerolineae bacterium]